MPEKKSFAVHDAVFLTGAQIKTISNDAQAVCNPLAVLRGWVPGIRDMKHFFRAQGISLVPDTKHQNHQEPETILPV